MKQLYKVVKFIKNIRQEQWVLFFVHVSVWLMLFVAFFLFSLTRNKSLPFFVVLLYLYGFILFYLNYYLLTPGYLLPKKYLVFFISIFAIILFSYVLVDPLIHQLAINDFAVNPPPEFRNLPSFDKMPGTMHPGDKPSMPRQPQVMSFLLFTFLILSSSVRIFQK